jgi:hypothetical protein
LEELDEEQGGEDGPLAEGKTDKGKLTAASVKARLKAIKHDLDADEERQALEQCLALIEREAEASKKVKAAQKALDAKVLAHYGQLNETELKTLVVDDKWLATLQADVQTELDRVSQALTKRIRELAERYEKTLSQLDEELSTASTRVSKHVKGMKGVAVHQLLTGQARLPGFGGEWEMKRLGDVARFFKGKGLPKSALVLGGAQPCIHYGELFTQYGERIMRTLSQTDWVDGCVFSEEGDVLMPTSDVTPRGLAKASCILSGGVVVGGDILIIRLDKSIDGTFLREGLNNSPKSAIIHPSPNL